MPDPSLGELLRWLAGRRKRVRVSGPSMVPTLRDGETVLVDPRAYTHVPPRPGDVVHVEHPRRPGLGMIKRVTEALVPQGGAGYEVVVHGDNRAQSTDSADFGPVRAHHLRGRVTCRFLPR